MNDLVVGRTYQILHSRKGEFLGKLVSVGDGWAKVEIVGGAPRFASAGASAESGDVISVSLSLCTFEEPT
jgi:hypothetical protein